MAFEHLFSYYITRLWGGGLTFGIRDYVLGLILLQIPEWKSLKIPSPHRLFVLYLVERLLHQQKIMRLLQIFSYTTTFRE